MLFLTVSKSVFYSAVNVLTIKTAIKEQIATSKRILYIFMFIFIIPIAMGNLPHGNLKA